MEIPEILAPHTTLIAASLIVSGLAMIAANLRNLRHRVPEIFIAEETTAVAEEHSEDALSIYKDNRILHTAFRLAATSGFIRESGEKVPFQMELDPQGLPIFFSGNNTVPSFCIREISGRRAVAKTLMGTHPLRLRAPYKLLESLRQANPHLSRYFCPCELHGRGLLVDPGLRHPAIEAKRFDVVDMDHLEHPTLNEFVRDNKDSPEGKERLRTFAANFRLMTALFHQEGIVHGDYCCGNILVTDELQPVLIDLDSFGWRGMYDAAIEMGGRSEFQSYQRLTSRGSFRRCPSHIDYFSEWVIYASLIAYCLDSQCTWEDHRLYFNTTDLTPESNGEVFHRLEARKLPLLTRLSQSIHAYASSEAGAKSPSEMQPLEKLCPPAWYETWEQADQSLLYSPQ